MKTSLILAAAATVAGALLVTYLLKRKQSPNQPAEMLTLKKSHHLTNVFAHAKNHNTSV
jgi:hypothetical protein